MKKKQSDAAWDAIKAKPDSEADIRARANLMIAIHTAVRSWEITQAAAAKRLGLTQPRMNDLMRGRVGKFSLEALINLAYRAGLSLQFNLKKPPDQTPNQ